MLFYANKKLHIILNNSFCNRRFSEFKIVVKLNMKIDINFVNGKNIET